MICWISFSRGIYLIQYFQLQIQQQLDTSTLELAYEKALLHTKIICCAEETRQCRTQMILLQCENDELRNKVAQSDNRFKESELQGKQLKARLNETMDHLEKARFDARAKSRDNEMLTVCRFAVYDEQCRR